MRIILCLLTSLVFAAHALLGCGGAHRTCDHRTAIVAGPTASQAGHDCVAHHDGYAEQPCDGENQPLAPCPHFACSFVKAETQRVDFSNNVAAIGTALASVDSSLDDSTAAADFEPVCRADHTSTRLYVWHCALII